MSRRLLSLAAISLLLLTAAAGLSVAASNSGQSHGDAAGYTLHELQQDGKHYSVPSARIVPEQQRVYWLEHTPANQPWRDVTKANNGPKFASGSVLKTNTIYLRTIRAQTDSTSVNVTMVFWEPATRTVTKGNTTTTDRYAANVSVVKRQVTLGPGWAMGKITLPRHSDPTRVTMWIQGHSQTARWTFTHHSIAFTHPLDANTWAEFVMLGAAFIIIPALGTGIWGSRKVRTWIDKAAEPPGHGAVYYSLVALFVTAGIVWFIYTQAAEIIVTIPPILGISVGVIYIGYMLSTHKGQSEHKVFWQPHIESVSAFTESKIPSIGAGDDEKRIEFSEDMPFGQMQLFRVIDEGQDGMSIVRDGWLAFLARLKGGRAKIENANELRTRFPLWNSFADEVFIVDPDADSLIDYERPGLRLQLPDIDSWQDAVWPLTIVGLGVTGAWKLTTIYGPVAWAALAIAVPYLVWKFAVTGTDSYVHVDPAPVALRSALASMLVLQVGQRDAADLEEAEEFAWRALADRKTEAKNRETRRNRSVTEYINNQRVSTQNGGVSDDSEGDDEDAEGNDRGNGDDGRLGFDDIEVIGE